MKLLGVDFGLRKIGISFSEGVLAQPLKVITFKKLDSALEELIKIVKEESIEKIIFGLSEGLMAESTIGFARKLEKRSGVEVDFEDESFSTENAKKKLLEIEAPRKKRRVFEDAIAAALVLQSYIHNHEHQK